MNKKLFPEGAEVRAKMYRGLREAEARIASSIQPLQNHFNEIGNGRTASEVMATQGILDARPHSTDIWSTARALNVLREESYKFGGSPVIEKTLEDAARYLGEFGQIRSRAESSSRAEYISTSQQRACAEGRREILSSEAYREGERIIAKRQADKLRTETRKTSKKAVKRG